MAEGFFERWSRRKQAQREASPHPGLPPEEGETVPAASAASAALPSADAAASSSLPTSPASPASSSMSPTASNAVRAAPPPSASPSTAPSAPPAASPAKPASPTLDDVAALTPDSDFRPFVAAGVAPEVRNAAMRQLFADPHFNVMDGLDVYIDDYAKPSPLPPAMLRRMASAQFLKLFDDAPEENPEDDVPQDVAQSAQPSPEVPSPLAADVPPASQGTDDHHADLRLQPDDAARAEDARGGAG